MLPLFMDAGLDPCLELAFDPGLDPCLEERWGGIPDLPTILSEPLPDSISRKECEMSMFQLF